MSNPVIFTVPDANFNMDKNPPKDNQLTIENIIVTGPDYTRITIPAGVIYNNNSSTAYKKVFTGPNDGSKQFIFEFPQNTIHNHQDGGSKYSDIFITSSNIYYSFNKTYSVAQNSSNIITTVNMGTIDITNTGTDGTPQINDIISPNPVMSSSTTTSTSSSTTNDEINSNLSNKILILLYTLITNFIVIVTIWIIVINIGIWGTVDSNLVHPFDVTKYPYTFNRDGLNYNLTTFKPESSTSSYCTKLDSERIGKISIEMENTIRKSTSGSNESIKFKELLEKLDTINPSMSQVNEKNIYYFSKLIQSYCSTNNSTTSSILSIFIYWISYLVFMQSLDQTYILNGFHKVLNIIIKSIETIFTNNKVAIFALSILIYGIIIAIQPMTEIIKKLFHKDKDSNFIDKPANLFIYVDKPENIFIYSLINILTVLIVIIIPIFFILFLVGLLGHIRNIINIIFESNSVVCAILSIIALGTTIVAFFEVIKFIIMRGAGGVTIDSFEKQFLKFFNFSGVAGSISSGAGVGIPLGISLYTAFLIGFRILLTTIYTTTKNLNLLIKFSPAITILLLLFLFMNTKQILGTVNAYITISIIGFYGIYYMLKK